MHTHDDVWAEQTIHATGKRQGKKKGKTGTTSGGTQKQQQQQVLGVHSNANPKNEIKFKRKAIGDSIPIIIVIKRLDKKNALHPSHVN